MNKAELIEAIVKETEMSKAGATRALNAVLDTIVKTVAKKQDVQLIGFGSCIHLHFLLLDVNFLGSELQFFHLHLDHWILCSLLCLLNHLHNFLISWQISINIFNS